MSEPTVGALVLTASVDDEDGIRRWVLSVGAAAREAQAALDNLTEALAGAPHIAITLRQHTTEGADDV